MRTKAIRKADVFQCPPSCTWQRIPRCGGCGRRVLVRRQIGVAALRSDRFAAPPDTNGTARKTRCDESVWFCMRNLDKLRLLHRTYQRSQHAPVSKQRKRTIRIFAYHREQSQKTIEMGIRTKVNQRQLLSLRQVIALFGAKNAGSVQKNAEDRGPWRAGKRSLFRVAGFFKKAYRSTMRQRTFVGRQTHGYILFPLFGSNKNVSIAKARHRA